MDVKSAFLNGVIEEEVYVKQPPGFEDLKYSDHIFKLKCCRFDMKTTPIKLDVWSKLIPSNQLKRMAKK